MLSLGLMRRYLNLMNVVFLDNEKVSDIRERLRINLAIIKGLTRSRRSGYASPNYSV